MDCFPSFVNLFAELGSFCLVEVSHVWMMGLPFGTLYVLKPNLGPINKRVFNFKTLHLKEFLMLMSRSRNTKCR